MTRAFFITTATNECDNHVAAWNSFNPTAERYTFRIQHLRQDGQIEEAVRVNQPDIIFYIGAVKGLGVPHWSLFRNLRDVAPVIGLISDAADKPWWPVIQLYREKEAFDLQVAIDGYSQAPVDHYTITAVAPERFEPAAKHKAYDCGFSGTIGTRGPRFDLLKELGEDLITVRHREADDGYGAHAAFLLACRSILNTSWTGSGDRHHIKGRVLEAGWAGAALLEHAGSPILDWFPPGYFFSYASARDVRATLQLPADEITGRAKLLAKYVREHYRPEMIYSGILEKVGLSCG